MIKEFQKFAMKGNVVDLAVGVILGVAFGVIITSLVNDIIMPPIGLLLGDVDFSNLFWVLEEGSVAGPYATLDAASDAGAVSINYGVFINALVNFVVVALAMFMLIRTMNRMQEEEEVKEATTKACPYCFSTISIKATRCPACTSKL
jgi:large conductance mechanosensitive channel